MHVGKCKTLGIKCFFSCFEHRYKKTRKSRLVLLCTWKLNLCSPWSMSTSKLLYIVAFSIFPQASYGRHSLRSGPRHAYTLGESPTSESPFSSWMVFAHPAGEQCEFYSSQRSKQPWVIEDQNKLPAAENVFKDSLQVVAFVLMRTKGHHTMGFILNK